MTTPPDNSPLYRSTEGYQKVMEHYDTTLQGMAVPYETRYVETGFGPTHTIISGKEKGKPVVLWHGQNAHAASWVHRRAVFSEDTRLTRRQSRRATGLETVLDTP